MQIQEKGPQILLQMPKFHTWIAHELKNEIIQKKFLKVCFSQNFGLIQIANFQFFLNFKLKTIPPEFFFQKLEIEIWILKQNNDSQISMRKFNDK